MTLQSNAQQPAKKKEFVSGLPSQPSVTALSRFVGGVLGAVVALPVYYVATVCCLKVIPVRIAPNDLAIGLAIGAGWGFGLLLGMIVGTFGVGYPRRRTQQIFWLSVSILAIPLLWLSVYAGSRSFFSTLSVVIALSWGLCALAAYFLGPVARYISRRIV